MAVAKIIALSFLYGRLVKQKYLLSIMDSYPIDVVRLNHMSAKFTHDLLKSSEVFFKWVCYILQNSPQNHHCPNCHRADQLGDRC